MVIVRNGCAVNSKIILCFCHARDSLKLCLSVACMIASIRKRFYQIIKHCLQLRHVVYYPSFGIRPRYGMGKAVSHGFILSVGGLPGLGWLDYVREVIVSRQSTDGGIFYIFKETFGRRFAKISVMAAFAR